MKIAIVGSRDFPDLDMVREYVESLPEDAIIESGGARGVDSTASKSAKKRGLETEIYWPNWMLYGKQAGFIRNREIVDNADRLVAFHYNDSKGTAHSIKLALDAKKEVEVHYADGDIWFNYVHMKSRHVCRIGTSRIGYRGNDNQLVLNTTVKSSVGLGKMFAPTWDMVMKSKRFEIDWEEYTNRYTELMRERFRKYPGDWLGLFNNDEVILCCYCHDTHDTVKHCHRYILVDILEEIAAQYGIGLQYIGEVYND